MCTPAIHKYGITIWYAFPSLHFKFGSMLPTIPRKHPVYLPPQFLWKFLEWPLRAQVQLLPNNPLRQLRKQIHKRSNLRPRGVKYKRNQPLQTLYLWIPSWWHRKPAILMQMSIFLRKSASPKKNMKVSFAQSAKAIWIQQKICSSTNLSVQACAMAAAGRARATCVYLHIQILFVRIDMMCVCLQCIVPTWPWIRALCRQKFPSEWTLFCSAVP